MDVVILFDENDNWSCPINGKTLAQTVIDNCLKYIGVQRLFISCPWSWAIGVSGKKSIFDVQISDVKTVVFRHEGNSPDLIKIYRSSNIQEAIVLSSGTPIVFPFMLEEVFFKTNNSVLFSTSWADLISGNNKIPNFELPSDFNTIAYIYSEIDMGASWDDVMEEFHGKENTIL